MEGPRTGDAVCKADVLILGHTKINVLTCLFLTIVVNLLCFSYAAVICLIMFNHGSCLIMSRVSIKAMRKGLSMLSKFQ